MTSFKFKIVLLGAASVGKTSLLLRYVNDLFREDYAATIGAKFLTKEIKIPPNDEIVQISIWDIAGQPRFLDLRTTFYRGASGGLMVFDLMRKESFEELDVWYDEMIPVLGDDLPLILIGNKLDLIRKKGDREVSRTEAEKFAKDKNIEYLETSAKTGTHVEEAFYELTRLILQRDHGINLPKKSIKEFEAIEEPHSYIVKSKIKQYIKSKGMRSSSDLLDGVLLNLNIQFLLDNAISRAEANGRKTVMPRDL